MICTVYQILFRW